MSIWASQSKDVLTEHPAERECWFAFEDHRIHELIVDWLESEDIEPTNPIEPPELPEVPESEQEEADGALLEGLTLLAIYLSSWEEELAPDLIVRRAWKGYLFEVLNVLEEKGYISQTRRAKSPMSTEVGVERAEEIEECYTASYGVTAWAGTLAKVCKHISGRECPCSPGIFTLTRLFATFARVAE
jgi:hypothetical protein